MSFDIELKTICIIVLVTLITGIIFGIRVGWRMRTNQIQNVMEVVNSSRPRQNNDRRWENR